MKTIKALFLIFAYFSSTTIVAAEFSYSSIAKRFQGSALSQKEVREAKMQGECLVGLKDLNFKKKNTFDPVAEWSDYRTVALLRQFPPCEVLLIMEIAQSKLRERESKAE